MPRLAIVSPARRSLRNDVKSYFLPQLRIGNRPLKTWNADEVDLFRNGETAVLAVAASSVHRDGGSAVSNTEKGSLGRLGSAPLSSMAEPESMATG